MALVYADPKFDLATLNQFVAQQENYLQGPLTSIGNTVGYTALVLNTGAGKPLKNSLITTGSLPNGSIQIGSGQIYITGNLTSATAYKP